MTCIQLRFGSTNVVPDMTFTTFSSPGNVPPITDLDNIKTEWRSKVAAWTMFDGYTMIHGTQADLQPQPTDYFSIIGSNLSSVTELRLFLYELNEAGTVWVQVYDSGSSIQIADLVPEGGSASGITFWLPTTIDAAKFSLRVQHRAPLPTTPTWLIRTLAMGEKLQMEKNIEYGDRISLVSRPQLVQTGSGSWVQIGEQQKSRVLSFNLPRMTSDDRDALANMESNLLGEPFIVSVYPDRTGFEYNDYNFFARFYDALQFEHVSEGVYSTTMTLVEA